jgi:hypothetical protein
MEFIRRNGSLNIGHRLEQGFALVSMVTNRVNGGKAEISDFLPDRSANDDSAEGEEGTVQDVMSLLAGLAKPSKKPA